VPVPTIVLIVPSQAAAVELPRRLASTGRALTGLYAFTLRELAEAIAQPGLLGQGLAVWNTGHDALLAARLLAQDHGLRLDPGLPPAPLARTLARTLRSLRMAVVPPEAVEAVARTCSSPDDSTRLAALAALSRRFGEALDGRSADRAAVLREALDRSRQTPWLSEANVLLVGDEELEPLEEALIAELARRGPVSRLSRPIPAGLQRGSPAARAHALGLREVRVEDTLLSPLAPGSLPSSLRRLQTRLFEPPQAEEALHDGAVELLSAPGEAAEVRAIVRRLLREAARGVPFEEMGVILPRPDSYAHLFTDLLERLGVPFRLHPSLPLCFGRAARALQLLFRCRGLPRTAVMEFLTFAPIPFAQLLGPESPSNPARWDQLSREAGIVSGYARWLTGLRHFAEVEGEAAQEEPTEERRERRLGRVAEAEALLRVVELLSSRLDSLSGEASWCEWSRLLREVFADWIGGAQEREEHRRVDEVLAELAGLDRLGPQSSIAWEQVEAVLESRFEIERLPLEVTSGGAVHVGALDAMAGLWFRFVAIPGLVEGGYPGALRPDPFLLDAERAALVTHLESSSRPGPRRSAEKSKRTAPGSAPAGQLSLFDTPDLKEDEPSRATPAARLATTQDRLLEARRSFHRAVSQAGERLALSYPRADPRSGRERLPSLFFVAAGSAVEGRALGATELAGLVSEDDPQSLALELAVDAGERDRSRLLRDPAAAEAVAAGSGFFRRSLLATLGRWHPRLTAYDGLVAPLPAEAARQLDPVSADRPQSASRLATFARCGFLYLLQYVLRLEPALEPEERRRLEPLERGSLFHEAAELFLRERRERGELPVKDEPEARERLLEIAEERLEALVAGTPPRFTVLWERERKRFRDTMLGWLAREAAQASRTTPAYFEVSFGLSRPGAPGEPHSPEPLVIELGDDRSLRVSGKIDRIDRRADGLVLRDYKTGRAPRDDGSVFKGGRQLQIPFYVLAAERLIPDAPVVDAFLDYVDGGRHVSLDPGWARSESFTRLLRGLVDAVAQGVFVQEPSACEWCDFTVVCGPRGLLERRRRRKQGDRLLGQVSRLRELG